MEPEGSLPHLQMSATCHYPEPDQSIPSLSPSRFLRIISLATRQWPWPIHAPYIPCTLPFPLLRLYHRISPDTRHRYQGQFFYGKDLLLPCPTPNREDHHLSAVRVCLVCSRLTSILEAVPSSTTQARAMPWWHGPTYHGCRASPSMCVWWLLIKDGICRSIAARSRILCLLNTIVVHFTCSCVFISLVGYQVRKSHVTKGLRPNELVSLNVVVTAISELFYSDIFVFIM
jgi:hypothetical protein